MDEKTMMEHLGKIEGVVSTLRKYASMDGGLISPKHHDGLWALVGALHFTNPGDQSKNDAWYINGTPKVDTIDPGQKIPESITHAPAPSTTPVYAPGTKTASVAPVAPTVVPAVVPAATQEPVLPPSTPEPSFQNLKANTKLAEDTLSQVEQTLSKVDALVTAGRKFNASRAKSDLHRVAADVNEIISHVDLAQPWVRKDLQGLADRSAHLFGLFPAKV